MPQALQQVREDLGSEAVILDSRKIGGRGERGHTRTPASVEVTAGLEEGAIPGVQPSPTTAPAPTPARRSVRVQREATAGVRASIHTPALFAGGGGEFSGLAPAPVGGASTIGASSGNPLESALESARRVAREFAPELEPGGDAPQQVSNASRLNAHFDVAEDMTDSVADVAVSIENVEASTANATADLAGLGVRQDGGSVAHQLQKLQETISKIERQAPAQFVLPGEVSRMADRLRAGGISETLVCQCIHMVYSELEGAALDDRDKVHALAAEKIGELLPERCDIRVASKRRNVIGFVGLSGSGKTTAAAKIAAGFATRKTRAIGDDPRRILMITTDKRRLGAVDQMRSLAQITGISHEVALTEDEMRAALKRHISARLVLIDTAGCGPNEQDEREFQRRLLEAAQADEVQVVIDGLTAYEHMLDVIESTSVFSPPRRLLFTKIDEAVRRGAAVSAAAHSGIPTSYFSVGPAFPGDLRPGNLMRLVCELLGVPVRSADKKKGA
jgi:flagellar biosynthesis GTPase FlhF